MKCGYFFFLLSKFLFPDAASEKPLDGSSSTDSNNPVSESEDYVSCSFILKYLKCIEFLRDCYIASLVV